MIRHVISVVLVAAMACVPSLGLAQVFEVCSINVKTAGSGANLIKVCVSPTGNVETFATPTDHIFDEGYAVCRTGATTYFDYNNNESGWGAATTTDMSPVTIVRTTTDGVFTLTQKFAVDTNEKDLTITMTLKNNSAVTQTDVRLMRGGDFNIGGATENAFARSADSVFGEAVQGMSLTATTFATPHSMALHIQSGTSDCSTATLGHPAEGDLGGRVVYDLGSIAGGNSKTVKVTYRKL